MADAERRIFFHDAPTLKELAMFIDPVIPFASRLPSGGARRLALTPLLSMCEREALELIARGFSCAEIARLKQVSVNTTRTHVRNVYAKLDVHSKTEAVFEAVALGLLRLEARGMPYHAIPDSHHDRSTSHPEPNTGAARLHDCA